MRGLESGSSVVEDWEEDWWVVSESASEWVPRSLS